MALATVLALALAITNAGDFQRTRRSSGLAIKTDGDPAGVFDIASCDYKRRAPPPLPPIHSKGGSWLRGCQLH